jgi:hypothetical protein
MELPVRLPKISYYFHYNDSFGYKLYRPTGAVSDLSQPAKPLII